MNTHIPLQPAIPRRQHDMNYPPQQHAPQFYPGYPHPYPPPKYPKQWYPPPYQHMGMPIPRPYHQYPPMISNPPFPMPQRNPTPLQHRISVPQHSPSSPSMQSHRGVASPVSSNTSLTIPSSAPIQNSRPAALTPPPAPPPIERMPYYPPVSYYAGLKIGIRQC